MARWLAGLGIGVFVVGVMAAFILRLNLPAVLLYHSAYSDPATLLLAGTGLVALGCLAAGAGWRWQAVRAARSLAALAAAQETEHRRFIQRLDHELKNPLTAIQVQLDNLQAVEGERQPALADVRTQVDRLAHLTRGLRRLADLETRALEIEPIEISELLTEVVELLQMPARIDLDVQRVPWPVPPVRGDRELLLVAFRNLVDNALKYSAAPVQVRAREAAGQLIVEVIDSGRGIQPAELMLVTEELYRGSNTRDVAGSGLGLAMVRRIVERHGGWMELRSRPGQGTIATVQLPYEQSENH